MPVWLTLGAHFLIDNDKLSRKKIIGLILAAFLAGRYPARAPKNINITVAHIASPVFMYGLEMKYFSSKLLPINFSVIIAKISPVYPEIVVINIDSCKIIAIMLLGVAPIALSLIHI